MPKIFKIYGLIIVYHLLFVLFSMGLVLIINEGVTEVFAFSIGFNVIYLLLGGLGSYISFGALRYVKWNQNILLIVHFIVCLLLMNLLCHYLAEDGPWITWDMIKGFFERSSNSFAFSLAIHILMLISYLLSVLITKQRIRQDL